MLQNKKVLALDIGERRIGVAVASSIARIASPMDAIDVEKTPDFIGYVAKLISNEGISVLVVGLPRGLDGQETAQTKYVRDLAKKIAEEVAIPVVMQDEAGTSVEAERRLKSYKKPYSKSDIDSMAAAIILSDYLQESYVS